MSEKTATDLIAALQSVLPDFKGGHPLHAPFFDEEEVALVTDCVRSGWVSSVGKYVDDFEREMASYTGAGYAVATVNGTAALHMAYVLAGVEADDEVLCPSLTFVATANAISYCHAHPHFVDIDPKRLTVCPERLRSYLQQIASVKNGATVNKQTGRVIRALVVMHAFGHPADLDALKLVCDEYGIALIEDAAESLGSFYNGVHTGNHGLVSAFSFNGNKILTTGGGGMIVTHDADLAVRAKHLTTVAKQAHAYDYVHDEIGYNYRLPNINAALGVAQMKKLPAFLKQKRALAGRYSEVFAAIPDVQFLSEPEDSSSNYWLNAVLLPDAGVMGSVLQSVHQAGFYCRPCWRPMHLLPIYAHCPRPALGETENVTSRLVNLPSSPNAAGGI